MRLGLLSGGAVLVLIIVGTLIARAFVYRRLGPIVETSVGNLIDRPVEIGPITGFSLSSIQIDGAAIPPTLDDDDYAKVPRVDVSFNPVAVLVNVVRDRTLPITLTFSDPELYLQEDADGRWVELEINRPEQEAPISLALETIKAKNATVIVAPFPQTSYDKASLPESGNGSDEVSEGDADALPEGIIPDSEDPVRATIANPVTLVGVDVLAHLRDKNRYLDAEITGKVAGGGRFDLESDVDFKPLNVNAYLRSRNVQVTPFNDLVKAFAPLPATLQEGTVKTDLAVNYSKASGISCDGTAQVKNVEATVDLSVPNVEFQPISKVNSRLGCSGQTITLNKTTLNYGTLPIKASGSVDLKSGYDLTAQVPKLTLEQIQETITVDVPIELDGAVGATVAVGGPLTQPLLTGEVRNTEPILADRLVADQVAADFRLTPTLLDITRLSVVPAVGGAINGKGRITLKDGGGLLFDAGIQDVPTDAIASLYGVSLPASVQLDNFNAAIDVFGDFSNVQAAVQWSLPNATYPGQGDVLYGDQTLRVRNTTIQAREGDLGIIANAFLDREEWDATVAVDGVDIPSLLAQLEIDPPQAATVQGVLSSDIALGGNFRQLTPEAISLSGSATLASAAVALDETPILDRGDWNTNFRWTGQDLVVEQFQAPGVTADGVISTNLQGPLTLDTLITQLNLNVAIAPYDLQRLQAFIPANLQARLDQQLAPRIAAPIYPQGQAQFEGTITGTLTQPQLAGTAQLDNFSVASFQFAPTLTGPVNFGLGEGGAVDLTGGGDRIYARLNERYLPSDFEIREDTFVAQGAISGRDRLVASIESLDVSRFGIRPLARLDLGPVQGVVNLNLMANLANLTNPQVDAKVAIAQPGLGTIAADAFTGDVSYRDGIATLDNGYFCLGRDRSDAQVQNDSEDTTLLEQCEGKSQFQLASVVNVFDQAVEQSQLTIENAHIQDILATLQWSDINDAARWLDFNAATFTSSLESNAADIAADAVGLPAAPLLDQDPQPTLIERMVSLGLFTPASPDNTPAPNIDQLSFWDRWLAQRQERLQNDRDFVPDLQDLDGQFAGTLSVEGSVKTGFNLNFDVVGDRWTWGPYQQETQFTAIGSASPDVITLKKPLKITSGIAEVEIDGQVGISQPSTSTLEVQNVPVGLVRNVAQQFVPQLESIPIALDGTLRTEATLNGTVFNPAVEGSVVVENPYLNQQPLEQAVVNFKYDQAYLTADGTIALQGEEKLTLKADVPYALPFMKIQPSDNRIALNVNVRDQGLALVNLFTQDQVTWESGTGEVAINVEAINNGGTLSTPQILGTLSLKDGQISSPFLTQPVTGITGTSEFNLQRITIDAFQAQLGSGSVMVQGELPIFTAANIFDDTVNKITNETSRKNINTKAEPEGSLQDKPQGLTVDVNALPLNIQKLLTATVDGTIVVNGVALAPIISGNIGVFRGRVNVAGAAGGAGERESGGAGAARSNPLLRQVILDGLEITLEDQLQIARQPLFDIEAIGGLTVTGSLADPRVEGDIELASGWINLFGTQFRLDRNEEHVAEFSANRALTDPRLEVTMNAMVREVERSPVPPSSPYAGGAEVSDQSSIPTFGGLQSVVITARVDGQAKDLLARLSDPESLPNPLELTSNPTRSERQIVALLGGEIFSALESGNTGLAIASYVGSGFVADVGDQIADALGLSQFSIFPTTDISGESRLPLTVGVEAGIDILPRRLSFSILEILDGTTNPQYGLRYRLSDQWQIRGSTDLNQDNRAILEFRSDF